MGPLARTSDGGPTLMRFFRCSAGGLGTVVGTGLTVGVAMGCGSGAAGRAGWGKSCRNAEGDSKTTSRRSSGRGSIVPRVRGDGGWLISIIRIVRWRIAETRKPWRWLNRCTLGPSSRCPLDPTG